ncbi:MAG: hypothetical protein NC912_02025 [Candidatus Omnitrophica bacterium]|nr:hypothetical protein [Candidatus Omnitrophota bacterium]
MRRLFLFYLFFSLVTLRSGLAKELEFNLDINSSTIVLPKIFRPNLDLSGGGYHSQAWWPQNLASPQVLEIWEKEIGFSGIYRIQFNLWQINQLAKDKELQDRLLGSYEAILKKITDSGGVVILNLFGTPAGLGRVLDKRSVTWDLKAFKEFVKYFMRIFSCEKKYNVWYEVWTAPDLEEFFLGRTQDYLNLYRMIAEAAKELEQETKINIPVGGPSVSWWFQNLEGNNILNPERSLIYELIQFCYRHQLPLDFISWHAYTTDPQAEKELTIYDKNVASLIKDWLTYFNFDKNTCLIIDEWNYDRDANLLPERAEYANITASYIPARIRNMYEAGLDYQLYFSLEDFDKNPEGVVRNTGLFRFEPEGTSDKPAPKSTYNIFKILASLGNDLFVSSLKFNDDFLGIIAVRSADQINLLIYNYIDPDILINYISRNLPLLNNAEKRSVINLIKNKDLALLKENKLNLENLHLTTKVKNLLKKALDLDNKAKRFSKESRILKINIKNLKEDYLYQRYVIEDKGTNLLPVEEKRLEKLDLFSQSLEIKPYSVQFLLIKKKPAEPEVTLEESTEEIKSEKDEIKESLPQKTSPELSVKPEIEPEPK